MADGFHAVFHRSWEKLIDLAGIRLNNSGHRPSMHTGMNDTSFCR
jgi:hypothetical protein